MAVGTAQFGLDYGIANASGRVPAAEVRDILERAAAHGLDTVDTAIAYGQSESSLGSAGVRGWRVITKLPPLPAGIGTGSLSAWVRDQLAGSLRRLRTEQLEAVLLHRPADLLGPHAEEYWQALGEVKHRGLTRRVGVSIYDPAELDALWRTRRPEIVQAPCNVLDRRLVRSGWLDRLGAEGIRVHVRSVFLQGLLLLADRRPARFDPWAALLDRWSRWCGERAISPLQGALAYALQLPAVERVVIGVDSAAHLEEVLALAARPAPSPPEDLSTEDRGLIDPSRWPAA